MNENMHVVYVQPPANSEPLDANRSFKVVYTPFDTEAVPLKANEVLVKNLYLSIDPYHRFGLYDPAITQSQFPATTAGTILATYGISEVVRSNNVDFAPGELLYSWVRWEKFTVVDESNLQSLQKIKPDIDPVYYLGPLGGPGLTGYAGITQVANPKQSETIVVSATMGAVGMVAAQMAKRLGLTVVGMASSDAKVRYLVEELGLDSAFNYRTVRSLDEALKEYCPNGIDIFFDLVGGEILDAALPRMNTGGRIPSAGMISQYNVPYDKRYGLKNLPSIVGMNITLQSYRNTTYAHLLAEMQERLGGWLMEGSMKFKMHIAEGLENVPTAFDGIFSGENFGKTVVKVL
jgi:NADPH-dependent curcumin reductase CurA